MSKAKIAVGGGAVALLLGGAMVVSLKDFETGTDWENIPYWDKHGKVWTVCGGSTGPHVKPGRYYTDAECEHLFIKDIEKHDAREAPCIKGKIQLNESEAAAYTHFRFNNGDGGNGRDGFCRNAQNNPSIIMRRLYSGDRKGACESLKMFKRAGGLDCTIRSNDCYGIIIRRERESKMCLGQWP